MIPLKMTKSESNNEKPSEWAKNREFVKLMSISFGVLALGILVDGPPLPIQEHINTAKDNYQLARNFALSSTEGDDAKSKVCIHLKAATDEMIAGNISYEDVGTTKEKFEMLGNRFGCTPN